MLIPNLDFGGAQRVFHDHAQILSEKYEIVECAFNTSDGHAYPTDNRFVSLNIPAGSTIIDKAWQFLRRVWQLNKLKGSEKPVMTISHLEGADYVNILSFGYGKKVLVVHGSKLYDQEIDNSFGWLRKKVLLPLLYKQADLIVTVSEGIRNELIHKFGLNQQKIITIYNFFSLEKLRNKASDRIDLPKYRKGFRLFTSGRLANQKNQLPLLHIVKLLREKYQLSVQLFFFGDGPLKDRLLQEARALSLTVEDGNDISKAGENAIIFLGYQDNPFRYYHSMDLFVFPSAWEGFPMALGEAMALGLPVVSADCPTGPLELLDPGWDQNHSERTYPMITDYGVLLPIPSIEDSASIATWVDTISEILKNTSQGNGMGKAAQARMQSLDEELMKSKWLNTVEKILA